MSVPVLKKQGGFTLLELLIVIVIIGILALLIIPNVTSAPKKARDTQRKTDLRAIKNALEEYHTSNSSYPTAVSGEATTILSGTADGTGTTGPLTTGSAPLLKKVPKDPRNVAPQVYTYESADGSTYTVTACLENTADNGENTATASSCGTNGRSFTLTSAN